MQNCIKHFSVDCHKPPRFTSELFRTQAQQQLPHEAVMFWANTHAGAGKDMCRTWLDFDRQTDNNYNFFLQRHRTRLSSAHHIFLRLPSALICIFNLIRMLPYAQALSLPCFSLWLLPAEDKKNYHLWCSWLRRRKKIVLEKSACTLVCVLHMFNPGFVTRSLSRPSVLSCLSPGCLLRLNNYSN